MAIPNSGGTISGMNLKTFKLVMLLLTFGFSLFMAFLLETTLVIDPHPTSTSQAVLMVGALIAMLSALWSGYEIGILTTPKAAESDASLARVQIRPRPGFELGKGKVQTGGETEVLVGGVKIERVKEVRTRVGEKGIVETEIVLAGAAEIHGDHATSYTTTTPNRSATINFDKPAGIWDGNYTYKVEANPSAETVSEIRERYSRPPLDQMRRARIGHVETVLLSKPNDLPAGVLHVKGEIDEEAAKSIQEQVPNLRLREKETDPNAKTLTEEEADLRLQTPTEH